MSCDNKITVKYENVIETRNASEIINDLTTGGVNEGLSAEQGKKIGVLFSDIINNTLIGVENPVNGTVRTERFLTYIFTNSVNYRRVINKISFYSRVAGELKIKRINLSNGIYTFIDEISIQTVIGDNVYIPEDVIVIEEGQLIGIYLSADAVVTHTTTTGYYEKFVYYLGDLITSTSTVGSSTNQKIHIKIDLIGIESESQNKLIGNSVLFENFSNGILPISMQYSSSPWSISEGVATTTSFGLINSIQGLNFTNINVSKTRAIFSLNDANASLSLFNRPVTFNQSGSIVTIEKNTNKIKVHSNWSGTNTMPSVSSEKVISFNIELNRKYRVEIYKNFKDMQFSITDMVNGDSDSISVIGGTVGIPIAGYAFGKPGVCVNSGNISLFSIEYFLPVKDRKIAAFYGDSITEGYQILQEDNYAFKAIEGLDNRGYVSAQSSCTSLDIIERLIEEFKIFIPDYCHVLIGTNESNMDAWLENIAIINDLIIAAGSIPVFGCLPANIQNTSQVSVWNAALLSKGYRTIRYDLATTINNDGINIDESLFLTDKRHPNAAGCLTMFNRLKLDAPYIFNT